LLTGDHHTAIVYTRRLDKDHPTMPTDQNPYKPPESVMTAGPLPATESWEKSVLATSKNAIRIGLFLALSALLMPHIIEWQAANVLREYGAEDKIGIVIEAHIEPLQLGFTAQALLSAVAIAAGGFVDRLHRSALHVLLITFALLIANSAWGMRAGSDNSRIVAAVGIVWLIFSLRRTWKTMQLAGSAP
jgi:hypothetical protein